MSITKPKVDGPARPLCPVCGKPAYSRGGVHPQCSVKQADAAIQARLRAQALAELAAAAK